MNVLEEEEDRARSHYLSVASDFSKDDPPYFNSEPGPSDTKGQHPRHRTDSSGSDYMPVTDLSRDLPPVFSKEPGPSDTKAQQPPHRTGSSGLDCLSMRSNISKEDPPFFNNEPGPSDTK